MNYWEELITMFPPEEQEAIWLLLGFLQQQVGIQDFEAFAGMVAEDLAEVFLSLPAGHPYWLAETEEKLRIAEGILSRARHILERERAEMRLWEEFIMTFPLEEQSPIWLLVGFLLQQVGIGELEELAEMSPEQLAAIFLSLPQYHPYWLVGEEERLRIAEEILSRARHVLEGVTIPEVTVYEFAGQILEEETGDPIPGLTVRGFDLDAAEGPQPWGEDITNERGLFVLFYAIPAEVAPEVEVRHLRLEILDPDGEPIHEIEVEAQLDQAEPLVLHIPALPVPEIPTVEITTLSDSLQLYLDSAVLTELGSHDIHTLADIRAAGGLAKLSLPQDVVETLEPHAYLSLLSTEPQINNALIERGYTDVIAIASTPLPQFLLSVEEAIEPQQALVLHRTAEAQGHWLNTMLTGVLADRANGLAPTVTAEKLPPMRCTCRDCESAVSPGAYLADLLQYATTNVRIAHVVWMEGDQEVLSPIDLNDLSGWFHQPFGKLPTSCEAAAEQLLQVRICIEVLRSYLEQRQIPSSVEESYRWAAYRAILEQLGTSYDELRQARYWDASGNDKEDLGRRQQLADRLGIDLQPVEGRDVLHWLLLGQSSLTEEALEKRFGLANTQFCPRPSKAVEEGEFLKLRLNHLRTQWMKQDWPDDGWDESIPLVNPDLISPDDIRPQVTSAPGTWITNPALELWESRRIFLDKLMKEVVATREDLPPDSGHGPVHEVILKYVCEEIQGNFDYLVDELRRELDREKDDLAADERLRTGFQISLEAYRRLMELLDKERQDNAGVSDDEWAEVCSIVVQVLKQRKIEESGGWIDTERTKGIKLTPKYFWIALSEPGSGAWPPPQAWVGPAETKVAWIDPDRLKLKDLPDEPLGTGARGLWRDRRAALDEKRRGFVLADRSNALDSLLAEAWGTQDVDDLVQELEHLHSKFQNLATSGEDTQAIEAEIEALHLQEQEFLSLMDLKRRFEDQQVLAKLQQTVEDNAADAEIRAAIEGLHDQRVRRLLLSALASGDRTQLEQRIAELSKQTRLGKEERQALAAILTKVHKRAVLYQKWIAEEEQAFFENDRWEYWRMLKARLPKGRADQEIRQKWQAALRASAKLPIVDPDLVRRWEDLKNPFSGDKAFELWERRGRDIDRRIAALKGQTGQPQQKLNLLIKEAVGISGQELKALGEKRKHGEDIGPRLDQLCMNTAAFNYLLRIHKVAPSIQDEEWDQVCSILLQVQKQRDCFAQWRREEREKGLTLSPDFFHIPERPVTALPAPAPAPLPEWRASASDRRAWQDTLKARVEQEKTTVAAMHEAIRAVEEAALPGLRDALIDASKAPGGTRERKARWLSDCLLIDVQAGGCQRTTRVAQAIETIQALVFGIRSGRLAPYYGSILDPNPGELRLISTNFDEAWQWLGSYATWRAAMFVFMYPENILLPTLRRHQTPAFRRLVRALRSNRRLSPEQACRLANDYADYVRDISTLTIQASCQTETRLVSEGACKGITKHSAYLLYTFARGGATGTIYWSTYNPESKDKGYQQSFWDEVPNLPRSCEVVGSVPYQVNEDQRHIFLFALTNDAAGEKELLFTKYNLLTQQWDAQPTTLELPQQGGSVHILVKQTNEETKPPQLAILAGNALYIREIGTDGKNWKEDGATKEDRDKEDSSDEWAPHRVYHRPQGSGVYVRAMTWRPLDMLETTSGAVVFILDHPRHSPYITLVVCSRDRSASWCIRWIPTSVFDHSYYGTLLHPDGKGIVMFGSRRMSRDDQRGVSWYDVFDVDVEKGLVVDRQSASAQFVCPSTMSRIAPHWGKVPEAQRQLVYQAKNLYRNHYNQRNLAPFDAQPQRRLAPVLETSRLIVRPYIAPPPHYSDSSQDSQIALTHNQGGPASHLTYIEETYYHVPMQIAPELQRRRQYLAALDWFSSIYDYTKQRGEERCIYCGLRTQFWETQNRLKQKYGRYERRSDWLLDPLNPHAIATRRAIATQRPVPQIRFTLFSLIRCLLEYADSEFMRDTPETVSRARQLYLTALDLLQTHELKQTPGPCEELIHSLKLPADDPVATAWLLRLSSDLERIHDVQLRRNTVAEVRSYVYADRLDEALRHVRAVSSDQPAPSTIDDALLGERRARKQAFGTLIAQPDIGRSLFELAQDVTRDVQIAIPDVPSPGLEPSPTPTTVEVPYSDGPVLVVTAPPPPLESEPYRPKPPLSFCIPPNPVLNALRMRAELNLHKIRNCRNIAGMKRELTLYAAPTDTTSGLPTIGARGQISIPTTAVLPPTPYRYDYLIERARQLVDRAAQMEAALLAALEKYDAETYNLMKARQDVQLARAGVRLQSLRVREAEGGVKLAELQQDRAQIQADHYKGLLDEGISALEFSSLALLGVAATCYAASAVLSFVASALPSSVGFTGPIPSATYSPQGSFSAIASGMSSLAAATSTTSSMLSTLASYERREQEWGFQRTLVLQDKKIGAQQVGIAEDYVRVVGQERDIAQMQTDFAEATVDFLHNKFTSAELYDWMSQVLEGVYSYFLQQATGVAKLAEMQLAFERQQIPPAIIQADYWEAPAEQAALSPADSTGPDRRGLTGSARLLADIYKLDQYRFETERRKLQLTKTISLARLAPAEFQRFRETGMMHFATPMELFDRDFPGHYLRLMKRVRTSVIALIPPMAGIRAALSTTGLSRVVAGSNGLFQVVQARRPPESVALSSPRNATGLFELTPQSQEMLLPFEVMGVDTTWEFRMPKASNQFDYSTIADVLVTIEYTALDSFDYRQQVLQRLDRSLSADRPFSFRHQFADQWYDLHNPDRTATPMVVSFRTRREDFPPNIDNLKIQQVLLYFSRADDAAFEVSVAHLRFTEQGATAPVGGGTTSIDGLISTRRGNGSSWMPMIGKSPIGEWELALPNSAEVKNWFKNEEIEDILFVITYAGRTPAWPA